MEKFTHITASACPLPAENIDTDQILPARYLKLPRKGEHGKVLFHDLRFDAAGNERPDFPLNRPGWRDAKIIVAGRNFGGGSVREADNGALLAALARAPASAVTVDLESQSIACGEWRCEFTIDSARRTRLLNGWDDFDVTDSFREQIATFEAADRKARP